jgi:hypothetical protein
MVTAMKMKPTRKQQETSPATSADADDAMVQIGSDLDQCRCLHGCAITLNPLSLSPHPQNTAKRI